MPTKRNSEKPSDSSEHGSGEAVDENPNRATETDIPEGSGPATDETTAAKGTHGEIPAQANADGGQQREADVDALAENQVELSEDEGQPTEQLGGTTGGAVQADAGDTLSLPQPLAVIFTATGLGLAAVLILHVGLSIWAVSSGSVAADRTVETLKTSASVDSEQSLGLEERLSLIAAFTERETTLHLHTLRINSAILGGVILLVTGTMLVSAVVVGVRTPQGFWGVPEGNRYWFLPGVLLSAAGAALLSAALATNIQLDLPINADGIQAKYLQGSELTADTAAIQRQLDELQNRGESGAE